MRSRFYTIDGVTKTLGEWCREFKLPYLRVFMRIKRGMTFAEAITKPEGSLAKPRKHADSERLVTMKGKTQSLHAWAEELGLPYNKILKRILRGWDPVKALTHRPDERAFDRDNLEKRAASKMVGERFGRLLVIEPAKTVGDGQSRKRYWLCKCDCGKETVVQTSMLTGGHTKSCGCLVFDNRANLTHGKRHDRIYTAWMNMKARCENPKSLSYQNYGTRGIAVCERWQTFENFYADMGDPPEGFSIERKDNHGNYEPDNCVWATRDIQSRNTRQNVWVTIGDRTQVLTDWCRQYDINIASIHRRLKKGWSIEQAIMTPKAKRFQR